MAAPRGAGQHRTPRVRLDLPFAIRCRSCGTQAAKHTRFTAAKLQAGRRLEFHCQRCGSSLSLVRSALGVSCGTNTERVEGNREPADGERVAASSSHLDQEKRQALAPKLATSGRFDDERDASKLGDAASEQESTHQDDGEYVKELLFAEEDLEKAVHEQQELGRLEAERRPAGAQLPSKNFTIRTELTIPAAWTEFLNGERAEAPQHGGDEGGEGRPRVTRTGSRTP